MAADEWYRQTEWTEEGAALFEEKIARARSQKAQYLTLQAYHLLDARPDVSLKLLDRADAADQAGDGFEQARINTFRAEANLRLGQIEDVLAAYKRAMKRQDGSGVIYTSAALDYAFIVSYFEIAEEYRHALQILEQFEGSPIGQTNAQAWGAHALILGDQGDAAAKPLARDALAHRGDDREVLRQLPPQAGGIQMANFVDRLEAIATG
ncbi:MAG: hypothetical protein HKO13_04870 [Sphingomonas sp.]|nr:hypothetical protein [Sphingomonas sp.]